MAIFLAVYAGPCGPISREFEANDICAAWAHVAKHGNSWYDEAENELDLEPDAPAEKIAQAIRAAGYRPLPAGSDPTWRLYYETRSAYAWWKWYELDYSRWSADSTTAHSRCRAWQAGETEDGPEEKPRP